LNILIFPSLKGVDVDTERQKTGAEVTRQTIANFIEKASRLYEPRRRSDFTAQPLEM